MFHYKKQISGLHLETPSTDEDLLYITELYSTQNLYGMIPVDTQRSIISFRNSLNSGAYLRLIMKDNAIRGFIGGMQVEIPHVSERTVQQLYYYCNLEGIEAFRAVVIAHEGLVNYAEGLKAKNVLSPCSQFYKNDNLCRILKTQGWDTFGYMALWKTSHNSSPSSVKAKR